MITQQQVIEKAREFVGTPFALQGRIKGKAIDCPGVLTMTAQEMGLQSSSFLAYGLQNSLAFIIRQLEAFMDPVKLDNAFALGNVLVLRHAQVPNCYHLVLWTGKGIIHADNDRAKKVIEVPHKREALLKRLVVAFKFRGVQ